MEIGPNEFLSDEQWAGLLMLLRSHDRIYIGSPQKCRRFINAIFWVTSSGAQWKQIPVEFGRVNSIYRRFVRWESHGIWRYLHRRISGQPELQALLHNVDSVAPPSSRNKRSQSQHYRTSWSPTCSVCLAESAASEKARYKVA